MKRILFILIAAIGICTLTSATFKESEVIKKMLRENVPVQLEHRYDKRQVLDINQFLAQHPNPIAFDGINICEIKNRDGLSLSMEKLGKETVFVFRNAIGDPVEVYYNPQRIDKEQAAIYIHYLLAGNYMLDSGENSVFGIWQDFYKGKAYNTDPGAFYIFKIENNNIDIMFGGDRVSSGAPGSGDMPGAGGAGAILPFIKWRVRITVDGVEAKATFDDKYVYHYPSLKDGTNALSKAQCPWQGIDGKWAFTAVMPLTHALLKLFPKEALELMLAEIYARHGNIFEDSELQQYFDAQPWYKKSKSDIELTDIEQFNADLINEVIMSMSPTEPGDSNSDLRKIPIFDGK